jgi:hypothetical protein
MGKNRETKRRTEPQDGKVAALTKRELTDDEKARLEAYREWAGRTKPLKFKANDGGKHPGTITAVDLDDPLIQVKMAEAFGTTDIDAQGLLFDQVVQTFAGVAVATHENPDGFDAGRLIPAANRAAALLAGIKPRDELESMLAVQMIAVHNAAMHTAKLAILTDQTFEGKRTNMNYTAKLMALFTSQMAALKTYRTGGQQKVVVEHVNVNEGGQAVVGQVNMGGGANCRTEERPHAT